MHRKGTILLSALIVLIIISLALIGGVFYLHQMYQKADAQNVKLQAQLAELEGRQRQTASQLEESKKTATELALKLQEAKTRMDSLSAELAAEKTAHTETLNKLEQFKSDLSNQKSLREDLENRLNQVQDDGRKIKEQVKIMQQQKMELEEKIKNLEAGAANVELGKVIVNSEAVQPAAVAAPALPAAAVSEKSNAAVKAAKTVKKGQSIPAKGIEGKIMIVNKEFNFVVINLGSRDKINVGDEFVVSRSGRVVGEVKIEKVHEFMSAAGFAVDLKDAIRENDTVNKK
ncbi:MAG: hypothetical protein PHS66_03395 [Candidatus Omnitrophica bacterium]|nr:hypothetical protein [Candidatus Omnitrophota bacterium]